jgi:aminoglycoside 6'-N-acetyltransferase I
MKEEPGPTAARRLAAARVRPYTPADREALLALAPRLLIGIAPWLDAAAILAVAQGWIADAIAGIGPERAVFVAEDEQGQPLGFVSVARQVHFSGQPRAYVGELIVVAEAEGTGLGRALLTAAEAWATARGLPAIELDTGAPNTHARRFYTHLGYAEESVKLVKQLRVGGVGEVGR